MFLYSKAFSFSECICLDYSLSAAFEYYHFLFAYYLIHCQTTYPGQLWPSFGDAVYTRVSEAYLQYFLPFQGVIPFSSSPQRSPHAGTGHPTTPQFGMQHGTISSIGDRSGLLKVSSDMSTPPRHTSHVTDTSETAETETEIFLQVGREKGVIAALLTLHWLII